MHILSVHNHYKMRGGEEVSQEAEESLLRRMGHNLQIYREYNSTIGDWPSWRLAGNTIWSTQTYQQLKQHFQETTYDVVHVHNCFPLISPSLYYAVESASLPLVKTLHNYRLLCPNGMLFRDGRICEDCVPHLVPYPGVIHACYRQSRAATLTTAAMLTTHRLWGTWQNLVDVYIALTEFAREKFIEGGLPSDKIVVKPHFVFPDPGMGNGQGEYALFVGRLSQEKGLDVLLQSWEYLSFDIPLKVVGEGPLVGYVKEVVQRWPQVDYLGGCTLEEVYRSMQKATVVIVPSVWYETFGRVVIEAFAVGTPVIVTQIGAIAELVEEGRTGLHFALGDAEDLAAKVDWIFSHPQAVAQMRKEARFTYETHYTAQVNYDKLLEIYDLARSRKNLSK